MRNGCLPNGQFHPHFQCGLNAGETRNALATLVEDKTIKQICLACKEDSVILLVCSESQVDTAWALSSHCHRVQNSKSEARECGTSEA